MDQRRIGEFLKELRKEKGLTQEQLADKLFVTRRTVSRWETGSNMPDLEVLVELADLYDVDLRDIFNGQRRDDNMDKELKDTLLQAADYTQELKEKVKKRMNLMFIGAILAMIFYLIAIFFGPDIDTGLWGIIKGLTLGVSFGMLIMGFIITSPFSDPLMKWKNEHLRSGGNT